MEKLLKVQNEYVSRLNKAEQNYKKSPKDRVTPCFIETRLEVLNKLFSDFQEGHKAIASLSKEYEELYFTKGTYESFEEDYIQYKSSLLQRLAVIRESEPTKVAERQEKQSCNEVKLPRIQLPSFSGKYEEWQTYFDMFTSLIHNNKSIASVQKLHYLKSSLTGEPFNLLRDFCTTEANYAEAWKQLVKRYNNKRYICNEILKKLFTTKRVTNESATGIRQLLDTVSTCLKSLENIGYSTSNWDIVTNFHVVSKLDPESVKQWEQQLNLTNEENPT